jgi:putative transcriptional regulator
LTQEFLFKTEKGGVLLKLGNNMRRCRFDHNEISQEELANSVGVTRQTILSIEKGKFVPSTLLALKLAKFFGKAVDDIFYIIENDD